MDWGTLVSAFVGGIAGSLVTGLIGYIQLRDARAVSRRDRQLLDADVVADTDQLLKDIAPPRLGMSLGTPEVETERWAALKARTDQVYRELVKMAAGHQVAPIRVIATDLSSAVLRASSQSQWLVRDMLNRNATADKLAGAEAEHASAEVKLAELKAAIQAAGAPVRLLPRARQRLGLPSDQRADADCT